MALQQPIPSVPGIDREDVNLTMEGRGDLFDMLVTVFLEQFAAVGRAVEELLERADDPPSRAEALRSRHAPFGAAARLGAFAVKTAAGSLHAAVRAGTDD